jgi:hypothetical protein
MSHFLNQAKSLTSSSIIDIPFNFHSYSIDFSCSPLSYKSLLKTVNKTPFPIKTLVYSVSAAAVPLEFPILLVERHSGGA